STERTLAMACTVVQTPQKRWVNSQASRGSRPRRIFSMPRHMVQEAHAFDTAPLSTSTSMRRWPSIREIGSIVIRFDIRYLLYVNSVSLALQRRPGPRSKVAARAHWRELRVRNRANKKLGPG